jgi:recombination protein RecA
METTKETGERAKALRQVIGNIEKQYGKGAIMALGEEGEGASVETISTGSLGLDIAIGGGYPRGRIIEVYGPESSGKTTLTLHAIREVQRAGGAAAFIDAEHALDVSYARAIGVDCSRVLVSQPDNGEQALEIAETLARSGAVELVVIDSVAALVPKAEIEGDMGDPHMGLQARLMSQALRKIPGVAHRTSTTLIFINQLRQKIGVTFGNPETTTGGNALKFYASLRLDVRRAGQIKSGDETIGVRTRVKVVKNKLAPPFREAEFDLRWGGGIDLAGEVLDQAVALGVVEKSGAHLSFAGEHLGHGRERAREAVLAKPQLLAAIREAALVRAEERRASGKGATPAVEAIAA